MPESEGDFFRIQSAEWPAVSTQIVQRAKYMNTTSCRQFEEGVAAQVLAALPLALQDPQHPLLRLDPAYHNPHLKLDGLRKMLDTANHLSRLDVSLAEGATRTSIGYDRRQGYRDGDSVTLFRDRVERADETIQGDALDLWKAAQGFDATIQAATRACVAGIVKRRLNAIQKVMGTNGLVSVRSSRDTFLKMYDRLVSDGVLRSSEEPDLERQLAALRGQNR